MPLLPYDADDPPEPVGREEMERIRRLVPRLEHLDFGGTTAFVGDDGVGVAQPDPDTFEAFILDRADFGISSGTNAYPFAEAVFDEPAQDWVTKPGGVATPTEGEFVLAFERNRNPNVRPGTRVEMRRRGPLSWVFSHCCTDPPALPPPGSGSGSGQGGPGSACVLCEANTPVSWSLVLSGFTGDLALFNGSWQLEQASACVWLHADALRAIFLEKVASGFRLRLHTQDGDFEVQYLGGSEKCCATQSLSGYSVLTGSPSGSHPSSATATPQCGTVPCPDPCDALDDGVAPAQWVSVLGSGWTDDGPDGITYSALNGVTATLHVRAGPCRWEADNTWVTGGGAFLAHVSGTVWDLMLSVPGTHGPVQVFYRGTFTDGCQPATFTLRGTSQSLNTPPSAFAPATLVFTPSGGCCPPGGGGGVSNGCCPAVPTLLSATVTSGGTCNGSYPITYDAGTDGWHYAGTLGTCPSSAPGFRIAVFCNLTWKISTASNGTIYDASSAACGPPIHLVFTGVDLSGCGGGASATITVTPP